MAAFWCSAIDELVVGKPLHVGSIINSQRHLVQAKASRPRDLLGLIQHMARTRFQLTDVVAAKFGPGMRTCAH